MPPSAHQHSSQLHPPRRCACRRTRYRHLIRRSGSSSMAKGERGFRWIRTVFCTASMSCAPRFDAALHSPCWSAVRSTPCKPCRAGGGYHGTSACKWPRAGGTAGHFRHVRVDDEHRGVPQQHPDGSRAQDGARECPHPRRATVRCEYAPRGAEPTDLPAR